MYHRLGDRIRYSAVSHLWPSLSSPLFSSSLPCGRVLSSSRRLLAPPLSLSPSSLFPIPWMPLTPRVEVYLHTCASLSISADTNRLIPRRRFLRSFPPFSPFSSSPKNRKEPQPGINTLLKPLTARIPIVCRRVDIQKVREKNVPVISGEKLLP